MWEVLGLARIPTVAVAARLPLTAFCRCRPTLQEMVLCCFCSYEHITYMCFFTQLFCF